jgi:hypothetical protein
MKTPLIIFTAVLLAVSHPVLASDTYKLTLWNQHNGDSNERGTKTCKIEAFKDGKVVWKNDAFKLLWRPNQDNKSSLSIPVPSTATGIDAFKISITEWVKLGGGLAEVQVFKNDKEITSDCKIAASASFDSRYTADKLTDKVTTSKTKDVGYWLLPDNKPGFIDIKLP